MDPTPPEIVKKLASCKSSAAQCRLLARIPEASNFWFEGYHGLSRFEPYPYRFVLGHADHQGQIDYRSAPGVLRMILEGMLSAKLDRKSFIKAVTALSLRARSDEWKIWFAPVLAKSLCLPVPVSVFNRYAPQRYRVMPLPAERSTPIVEITSMPANFYIEPLLDGGQRVFWFLRQQGVQGFLEDSTEQSDRLSHAFEEILNPERLNLVLEGYVEESTVTLLDIGDADVFLAGGPNVMPLAKRYEALKALEGTLTGAGVNNVLTVEAHLCSLKHPDKTREHFNLIVQQGYNGAVLRHDEISYGKSAARITVMPTKKSTLTCTEVREGSPGTRYEGAAEYLVGRGTMHRRTFVSPVFSGLTFEDRRSILGDKRRCVGRKFEVLSCGLGADSRLIFPVFTQWRS